MYNTLVLIGHAMPHSQVGRLLRRKNPKKCSRKRITKDLKKKELTEKGGRARKEKAPTKTKLKNERKTERREDEEDIETNFRGESGLRKNSLLRMSNLRNNPFEDSNGRNSRQKPFLVSNSLDQFKRNLELLPLILPQTN